MGDDKPELYYLTRRPIEGGHIKPVFIAGGKVMAAGKLDGLEQDSATGALVSISIPHHEVHEGEMFEISYKSPDASPIADNGTIAFLLRTGAKYDHLVFGGNAGGDAELELLEAPAITDDGAALTEYNMNRAINANPTTVATLDPTVTGGTGSLLFNDFIPGGTGGNSVGGTGAVRVGTEWILRINTAYVMRVTNRAGNAQPMSLLAQWYEESDL